MALGDENMGKFITQPKFVRHFPVVAESFISHVGYNDFSEVKPAYAFRVQTLYTLHIVLSGSGTLEMDGKTHRVNAEEMFFIPPGVAMRYFPDRDAPWEYVWFTLKGDTAQRYGELLDFSLAAPVRSCRYFHKIRNALSGLFDALESGGGYFSALSCLYAIMDICTSYAPKTGIRAIKEQIDEGFVLPEFSIDRLCRDAGISHAHLLRLFKQAYGCTIKKYVTDKRMDLASELLLGTDLSVRSVAYSCGFADEIHFMKIFKKEKGISALQFRKKGTAPALSPKK